VGGDLLDRAQVRRLAETLRKRVRRAETDDGLPPGLTSHERQRLKTLERENRELRRANEILKSAALSSTGRCTAEAGAVVSVGSRGDSYDTQSRMMPVRVGSPV
jgi:hypothetical protein